MSETWRRVTGPLSSATLPTAAPWPCGISDDASPFEFSFVLDPRRPEIRLLWESQGESGDLAAKMDAALATQRRLQLTEGASSRRFDRIADLFLPTDPQGAFVLWHAARLWPTRDPELKAYLNPQVRGRTRSRELVRQALDRLGLAASWPYVERTLTRGDGLDELRYVSLDLRDDGASRVKVYVYHHEATAELLARDATLSPSADPARVAAFFERVTDRRPPAEGFNPGVCLSFVEGRGAAPTAITLHVPVRAYVNDDDDACDRVAALAARGPIGTGEGSLLAQESVAAHRAAVLGLAKRPLDAGVGLTTYVSLRSERSAERVTCYLATELFSVQAPRNRPSP